MRCASILQFFIICVTSSLGVLGSADDVPINNGSLVVDKIDFPKLEVRIVNGTKADLEQFPHQVSLRRNDSQSTHFCGGSVIDDHWILTAAHCMVNEHGVKIMPASITVVAGQVLLTPTFNYTQQRAAGSIIVHKQFHHGTLSNDIALIWLKNPLNFNTATVKPAKLAENSATVGRKCEVSGWGCTTENTSVSNNLMFVELPIVSTERCRQLLCPDVKLPLDTFCAGYDEGGKDACQGDSGGGMMCDNLLTGIVSGGKGCAHPLLPGFYTAIPAFKNWIMNEMKLFNSTNGTHPNGTHHHGGTNNSNNVYSSYGFYLIIIGYTLLSYLGISFGHIM